MATWVVKISKYCNLRCAYCYEWDELGDKRRMSPALWERVLVAARSYRDRSVRHLGDGTTKLVLHGGEPLAAPLSYLKELGESYRRVIGSTPGFSLDLQTNLYRLTEDHISFLKDYEITPGVSFDLVGGVRRSLAGKETEASVARNMDRLDAAGIRFGAIAVLARHTAPRLREVYDFFAARQIGLRILPLSEGSSARPEALFSLGNDDITASLKDLFVHWIEGGRAIDVTPFDDYVTAAARNILGKRDDLWNRRNDGEGALIVNTDGRVYRMDDLYEEEALVGDLSVQTMDQILASERYEHTLAFDEALHRRVCGGCSFEGACTGIPVLTSKHGSLHQGRCAIAYPMHQFVQDYFEKLGFTKQELEGLLQMGEQDAA